eukprot:SAG31_NODE_3039_length_4757_cov_2.892228_5_plen_113_part_00
MYIYRILGVSLSRPLAFVGLALGLLGVTTGDILLNFLLSTGPAQAVSIIVIRVRVQASDDTTCNVSMANFIKMYFAWRCCPVISHHTDMVCIYRQMRCPTLLMGARSTNNRQ